MAAAASYLWRSSGESPSPSPIGTVDAVHLHVGMPPLLSISLYVFRGASGMGPTGHGPGRPRQQLHQQRSPIRYISGGGRPLSKEGIEEEEEAAGGFCSFPLAPLVEMSALPPDPIAPHPTPYLSWKCFVCPDRRASLHLAGSTHAHDHAIVAMLVLTTPSTVSIVSPTRQL